MSIEPLNLDLDTLQALLDTTPARPLYDDKRDPRTRRAQVWMDDAGDGRFVADVNEQWGPYAAVFAALHNAAPALLEAARERDALAAECEKWRSAASVLCAKHVGVTWDGCPACGGEELDEQLDRNAQALYRMRAERDALTARLAEAEATLAKIAGGHFSGDAELEVAIRIHDRLGFQSRMVVLSQRAAKNYKLAADAAKGGSDAE